jgi:hypothetical protein
MSFRPVKAENLDVSKVEFSEVKVMNNGGKTVYVNYGGQSIFLQTPEMEIPWDSGDFIPNDKDPQSGKYNIKVSLKDMENNPQVKAFHDAILAIDEKLKETAGKQRRLVQEEEHGDGLGGKRLQPDDQGLHRQGDWRA